MHFEMHGNLSWRCYGDAYEPPVVLLHPIATDGSVWERQAAAWGGRFRVIALDLPGHGQSATLGRDATIAGYAAAVAASLGAGGIKQAAFVGLSIGSMVAQCLAADEPALVRSAVLANGAFWTSAEASLVWQKRIAGARAGGMGSLRNAMMQRWFTPDFLLGQREPVDAIGDLIEATSVQGFVEAANAIARLDNRKALPRITCPVLVTAGVWDEAAPPSVVKPIAEAVPGARYLELPAAHLANVEVAELFNYNVGMFLDDTMASLR